MRNLIPRMLALRLQYPIYMKIYLSQDAMKFAAYIISGFSRPTANRLVAFKIRRLSENISPMNAANLAFWSAVYARMEGLVLPVDEMARLNREMPDSVRDGLVGLARDAYVMGAV